MAQTLQNSSEILFLYDIRDANPNGDPVDENKPRIDEETGINIVTDVRLKRTIRDYLHEYKGKEIFVLEVRNEDGNLKTKEQRLSDFDNDPQQVLSHCIDIRLFGSTTAVEDQTIALTGPVQFKYGRSLHKVDLTYIKGTTVMPSKTDKKQGTFTERYILPYSLIAFYGIVNENTARYQGINLTQDDIDLLIEAMWNGTKNLTSGSKFGQMPRLLMQVIYNENGYFIGELDRRIAIKSDKPDEAIRDISDFHVDITSLVNALVASKQKITGIRLKADDRLTFTFNGQPTDLTTALNGLTLSWLNY